MTNGLNQYSAAGGTGLTYDANGNLISETPPSPLPATGYTYDVENRLVAANGARTAALRYDPLGRLYEVTGPTGTTRFLYDGDALVAEYVAAGLAHVYVHGSNAGADDPLIWYTGGTIRWLHADHQGSITGMADPQGNLASINAYDEYGLPKANAANQGRFQYTGQVWLAELGMYHYKARIYSPTLGRFLQTDPVGYDDQVNLYAYVGNDPVNATDPTGMAICGSCSGSSSDGVSWDPRRRGIPGPRRFTDDGSLGGSGGSQTNNPIDDSLNDVQEITSNAVSQAAARMRETRGRGRTGEEVVRQALTAGGFRILGSQVQIRDIEGNLRIVDFIVAGGPSRMLGIEVKYGDNTRSLRQRTIDARIRLQGGRVVSRNIFDLPHGLRVRFSTMEMNARLVRTP